MRQPGRTKGNSCAEWQKGRQLRYECAKFLEREQKSRDIGANIDVAGQKQGRHRFVIHKLQSTRETTRFHASMPTPKHTWMNPREISKAMTDAVRQHDVGSLWPHEHPDRTASWMKEWNKWFLRRPKNAAGAQRCVLGVAGRCSTRTAPSRGSLR